MLEFKSNYVTEKRVLLTTEKNYTCAFTFPSCSLQSDSQCKESELRGVWFLRGQCLHLGLEAARYL
jgi:hypothetical protein